MEPLSHRDLDAALMEVRRLLAEANR